MPHDRWEDEEPIGVVGGVKPLRQWHRSLDSYLFVLSATVGGFMLLGAFAQSSVAPFAGALSVLAGAFCFSRSDLSAPTSRVSELTWLAAGLLLVVGGGLLFSSG